MKNLIAATYAPMHKDHSLNLELIKKYGIFLKSNNVSGAFVNGSTGDFVSLSTEERKQIIAAWAKDKPNDFCLVNHVGHTNLKEAQDLAEHSVGKADAIAALAPYYFKPPTLDSLVHYCKEIALSAPNLPFYYYHIPVLTGANFQMIDFLKVASKAIPNLAGIKYTENNLLDYNKCVDYKDGASNILFGVDEMLLSSLPLGANGWVGSTYNHLAPLYYEIIESFNKHEMDRAANLQRKAVSFVEILDSIGRFNGAGKSFMRLFGIDCGPSRYPHSTLTDQQILTAVEALEIRSIFPHLSKGFILPNN